MFSLPSPLSLLKLPTAVLLTIIIIIIITIIILIFVSCKFACRYDQNNVCEENNENMNVDIGTSRVNFDEKCFTKICNYGRNSFCTLLNGCVQTNLILSHFWAATDLLSLSGPASKIIQQGTQNCIIWQMFLHLGVKLLSDKKSQGWEVYPLILF